MPFSGGMLVGRDFVEELWYLGGMEAPAWLYRRVFELIFESGKLARSIDRSREIAGLRAEFAEKPILPEEFDDYSDLARWHRENFTMRFFLDYEG